MELCSDDIENSVQMHWTVRSEATSVLSLTDRCFDYVCAIAYKCRAPSKGPTLKEALNSLLVNLLRARINDPDRYVAVPMRAQHYSGRTIGYCIVKRAVDALKLLELIEIREGRPAKAGKPGRRTRIRATELLTQWGQSTGVRPADLLDPPLRGIVILRGHKPAKGSAPILEWPESKKIEKWRMQDSIRRINLPLMEWFIGLRLPDEDFRTAMRKQVRASGRCIDLYDRQVKRIFNNGRTDEGGRFSGGWWQRIRSEYRKYICMAAPGDTEPQPTVELDFNHIHPSLLYAKVGLPLPMDAYDLSQQGITMTEPVREYVKRCLLIMINAKGRGQAQGAVRDRFLKRYLRKTDSELPLEQARFCFRLAEYMPPDLPPIREVFDALQGKHAPIGEYFFSGVGLQLMCRESELAQRLLLRFLDDGECGLSVHDSFVVRSSFGHRAALLMEEEFRHMTGGTCEVTGESGFQAQAAVRSDAELFWRLFDDWKTVARRHGDALPPAVTPAAVEAAA
jgi:hypothetical protein